MEDSVSASDDYVDPFEYLSQYNEDQCFEIFCNNLNNIDLCIFLFVGKLNFTIYKQNCLEMLKFYFENSIENNKYTKRETLDELASLASIFASIDEYKSEYNKILYLIKKLLS